MEWEIIRRRSTADLLAAWPSGVLDPHEHREHLHLLRLAQRLEPGHCLIWSMDIGECRQRRVGLRLPLSLGGAQLPQKCHGIVDAGQLARIFQ
jgi:hypothetical protein